MQYWETALLLAKALPVMDNASNLKETGRHWYAEEAANTVHYYLINRNLRIVLSCIFCSVSFLAFKTLLFFFQP